jgi:hypothetical protein
MHWLLIGYMFLFIDRPFEVWPFLGDLRIERVYMLVTLVVWLIYPGKRILPNAQHLAYAGFAAAVGLAWGLSPWADKGQPVVEDWFKIVVFYVLLVTSVSDERGLKRMVVGFVAVMGLYLAHSFREYLGGRHTYRMGFARMIGVDSTLGDPNSFGAGIVYALPFAVALWRTGIGGKRGRYLIVGYVGLSVLCILLTGSRSSLIGLIVWSGLLVGRVRRGWLWALALLAVAPVGFLLLPESLQNRFETIVNPDAGPENAKASGEGRVLGFLTGLELWAHSPLSGVGPGAWRPATGSSVESHNLIGQLVGETGTVGLVAFLAILAGYWSNLRRFKSARRAYPEWANDLPFQVASAVGTGVFLLLFMGLFGHNLFRFTWLWYGGFLIVARHCLRHRLLEPEVYLDRYEWDSNDELPDEWVRHSGHTIHR